MAEPLREQVLAEIVAVLKKLPSAPTVTRLPRAIEQVNEFPHVFVVAGSGSRMPVESLAGAGTAMYRHEFRALVTGYVRGDDVTAPDTALQRLQDDVIGELLKNQTLGGVADGIAVEEDETDDGELATLGVPLAAFRQTLVVTMHELRTVA